MNPGIEAAWIAAGVSIRSLGGTVAVAYEADQLDPAQYAGWSVIATGPARPGPAGAADHSRPWAAGTWCGNRR